MCSRKDPTMEAVRPARRQHAAVLLHDFWKDRKGDK